MVFASVWVLLLFFGLCTAWMDERPVLEAQDGHLIISSAKDRNITLKIMGDGYVNVNEINLLHVASAAQNATRVIDRWRMGHMSEMENSLYQLTTIVTGATGLQTRVALLERSIDVNGTIRVGNRSRFPNLNPLSSIARSTIRRINVRLKALEDALRAMQTLLQQNECQSSPCQNGGTCEDLYDAYQCHCPSNWEGPNCMTDVNECARFLGTDLGCQNGATCRNLPGSYRCDCLPGWFGLRCTQKTSICNIENSEALCGEHGVCVAKSSSSLGYTCICDQGWESDGTSPACTKDVDECAAPHPPCSVNPPVPCRNTRGSFTCGPCPPGYSGNGYYCTDIDECLINNGGCSTSPFVQCMNTMGSRICGPCPPGYRGDGVSCIFVGGCAINNGGCHPLATCTENPSLTSSYVLCRCPSGYVGNGMGPNGCQLTDVSLNTACSSNPCVHGTCVPNGANGFTCTCNPGYSGTTCNTPNDPCSPNPCRNSGICTVLDGQATCQCTSSFTGSRCETPRQACGGVLRNPMGTLQFPMGGNTYQHGLSCAWVLITESSKVLNVTFTAFNLEQSTDCKFDFLQIHDGRNAGSQMINRFCGHTLPNQNGTIISSHNTLYLWFHSDNSISHDGFTLHWSSIDPICGGVLEDNYGTIISPGSPGRYPPNRDCFWRITVAETKRIQFHFGQLMLEDNCNNDYVEITGAEEERLGLFCNHTRPPPLVTPSFEATVHFHSDSSNQDAGFQIHYSIIEGIPGCGGIYTSATGMISSPGHSTSYQPNMECEWKIQLPASERVRITWSRFDLESSTSCQFDFIEIYDGPDTHSPLLGRYCGSDMPPTIKSNSNNLVVFFKSDWSYEGEGFILSYETLCGGEFHESSGIIQSPFYPEPYHHSKTCIYEIIQPTNKGIQLTMLDMDIEGRYQNCFYDYVEIFDGDNENATKLATLCGDEENMPNTPFFSTHNVMYIKFTTDNSIDGRGFKANYTAIDRRCGGLLKESSGIIQPPLEEGNYANNEECIWTIQAPPGYVIHLTWMSFDIEYHPHCDSDYIKIFESYNPSQENVIATYCGRTKPPDLTTQDRILSILFHTDLSVTTDGFVATYVFMDASKVCGGHYVRPNGVIRSPNYPDYYPNKKECVWIIEARNKHRIILTVEHFELEGHMNCAFDYLEIRNGGYDSAPLIGKFCGTEIPTEIPSQANQMYIRFVSDFSRSMQGFEIQWDSTTQGCGSMMTAVTGDIISPNYPEPYSMNAECYWKIAVAAGSIVQLVIIDLDLEEHDKCRYDFIEIFEGISRRTNGKRYCDANHPKIIQSKTNEMSIRFRSDYSSSGRGFHLKYETQCYNKLRGYYGVIESPNFPNKYEHSSNCSWTIEAPIGNTINLTFSHFDLEGRMDSPAQCTFDYVQIMEGDEDTPNTELGRFCGTIDLPMKINSTQHQVFVTFVTDSFIAFNGFRFEWSVHGCGGHLIKPYDSFTSPGYPFAYPTNLDCEWLIEVDYTHSVELTLHNVNTEKRKGCFFDKIQVYGGDNEDAPKLIEICYSEKPVIYTSPGNKMFIKFHSDSSYAGPGFNASYRSVPIECGGKFTATSGIIHSANYPQNYPHSQNCEWLIEVDNNHLVNLTFLDFDIENSRNCSDDYVKIFDGPTKDDPLLGTHCRNQLPPTYVSSSNQMLVVMRTDSLISAKGFKAQYIRACGARIIVSDHGFLTPPAGSTDQHDNTNCTWTLIAEDPADHITVTFTHMEMDPVGFSSHINGPNPSLIPLCFYSLEIFEGESIDGPLLAKLCNNVAPPPITSTGSSLTLHLVLRYEFFGDFVAMYSVLNTACGGNYTSQQGVITSPGYPNSYPLNAECVWVLNTSPGNRISLVFSEFDVESSENCDLDYLEIREDSGIGKLISISCGKDATEIASSNKLWIKFKSDGSGTAKGFMAEYNLIGGNELEGPTGRITSPLYPIHYKREATFSWRITVEMDSVIHIDFRDIGIENIGQNCYSNIKIYDGYDDEAPSLLVACGYTLPGPVDSSSNIVYIEMKTNFVRQGSWFDLTWLQIPRNTSQENNKEIKLSECNKEIELMSDRNNTYSFSSPGWPTGYADNLHCNWVFTSPPGTHLVLRIITMDLEETSDCGADSVSVYSGYALTSTSNAHLESKLCLANSSSSSISGTNVMTVKFETDAFVNKTGFNAYVYRDCGGKLTEPNGVIEYDNSSTARAIRTWHFTCKWTVTVRTGRTIKVRITDMSIQEMPDHSCGDNYLLLKNGDGMLSPLLGNGKYCGEVIPPELETTGNRFYIKATGAGHHFRFRLTYREVSMNCGGEFILTNKQKKWEISSPNYPNIPPLYAECVWKATAPAGDRLTIHFLERFDLSYSENCEREYVEIRDGGTDGSRFLGKFCKDIAPSSMSTTGNMIYVHFYTDVAEPKNGFKAVITVGEICGGILRSPTGVIQSPNYPHPYPTNQNCSWLIIAPTDHTLKLQFRDLELPGFHGCYSTDYVKIAEKLIENDTISTIGTYCGLQIPDEIETSTNAVYVTFESDNREYVSYKGFSLNFIASQETCGGSLTALNGIIKSPGYPNPRTRPRYCDWRIKVPIGYQIVVNILDIDVVTESGAMRVGYALSFYNDFHYKSKIKVLGQGANTETIRSSSDTMLIGYWSSTGHRGFKLRYTAEAPAPCSGLVRQVEGNLTGPTNLPFNETSFVCHWRLQPPEYMISLINSSGLTLSVRVIGFLGGPEYAIIRINCIYPQYIEIHDIGMLCGNMTKPRYLRSPKLINDLTIMNGTYGMNGKRINFDLQYRWQSCGGVLSGPSHHITSPNDTPHTITPPINCVWHIDYPEGETIKLSFTKLELESNCDRNYLIIKNGGATAPQIAKHCLHATSQLQRYNVNSISNQLWIEYYSESGLGRFEIDVTVASVGCGGFLRGHSREIASPEFPKQYPNNGECTWEIIGDNGYHIGLTFIDRFSLETSPNCEKDYVQVFDWIQEKGNYNNGEWKSIGKVCGRNTPSPFNSTTNRMKVIFHSNEAIQSDGFHAVWSENCGGIFQATDNVNMIQSPSFPNYYPANVFCNYTIVAPDEDIIVEFTDFQLEWVSTTNCRYDNVTVISETMYMTEKVETYCGTNKPPLIRSMSQIQIIFMTDKYVQRNGFQFKYFINKCGGIVTHPTELKPLMHGEEYFGRMNCTWIIKAPQGKSVLLRFEKFILEFSTNCYFDNVAVFEGDLVNQSKRIALVCGNLTNNLPTFKSDSNSMVVNFNADSSRQFEGFTAKVLFTTSPAGGCGGLVNLTSIQSKSFRTQQAATYQSFEECHWTVVTSPTKTIRFTINSMDIKNSTNNVTRGNECSGDYLEVRDGGGVYNKLLGQFCGNVPPLPIVSTSNKLWIRFYTDGTTEGAGATATLDTVDSLCGLHTRIVNETIQILTSPGYPNTHLAGTQCHWVLHFADQYSDRLRIRFIDFDLMDSDKCETDYFEITEQKKYINEGFGTNFIYSGERNHPITVEIGSRFPFASYKYCGNELPHEYYSYSDNVELTFKSTSNDHKGFKLEYSTTNCNRNYTSEQGRIFHNGFTSCWITITAPANHTISLYFNHFSIYDPEHCTRNALQIHEGDSSGPLITTLCSTAIPSPIFSTGNKLTLHSWTESASSYQSYDIIYTTTDAGRGCGGRIFNYGGRFTSPLYPNIYRNNTVCTWDVSVPRGFKIILQFPVFDIGTKKNCANNNLKVYDVVPSGELLHSTYCGGDDPARLEVDTDRILIKYTSTVNNIGSGWVIIFMAQSTHNPIDVMDNW
ncbi:cubilin-like [Pogonomyrmex barbatus]|uniref:Cubilin n=1 Tax=Pogonomyrmex barbatus TaxID=144034 RepID=A0A6I9WYR8_9HYME|nr:cubilin-like [Pogonomyrmex barbatus]